MHLFINECSICFAQANYSGFLCQQCFALLESDDTAAIFHQSIEQVFCSYRYQPPLSQWLVALKDQQQLASLAKLQWLMLQRQPNFHNVDAIVFIPSDSKKLLQRGFNPAELLARHIAKHWQLPIYNKAFIKHSSADQRGLSRRQRRQNIRQSLQPEKLNLSGQHIVLIEDVLTTGATAIAAAQALKQQGAKKISVWALAHTPLQKA